MMKTILAMLLLSVSLAHAKLVVKIQPPKRTGSKVVIRLELKNTFSENIESARATVFLLDEKDKVVGQSVQWIIGGTEKRPALASNAKTSFSFVVLTDKSFQNVRLICNRIILEGGKLIEPNEGFEIEKGE